MVSGSRRRSGWLCLAAAALLVSLPLGAEPGGRVRKKDSAIELLGDLDLALGRAKSSGKPVLLVFTAVWCPVCRQLEDVTFLEPPIQALADDFLWVKVDVDRELSLAEEWGVEATPTMFLLDPAGSTVQTIVGGASADELASRLGALTESRHADGSSGDAGAESVLQRSPLTLTPGGYRGKSICFSHVGYGPLSIGSQSPFQALRLGIVPRTPSTLARGDHQVLVGGTWSNIWASDEDSFDPVNGEYGEYLLDYETLDASITYTYGISDPLQIEVDYEQRARFGGAMDGLIEGFHDLLGIGQSGRDRFDRNRTNIIIDPQDGNPPVVLQGGDASGTFARDLLVTLQHNVSCGTARWPAFSWALTGRYSIDRPDELEGDRFDVAVSAAVSRRFGQFYAYLTLGYAWYGTDAVYTIALETHQATILAAAEWRFAPRMSLLLQYLGTQGAADDLGVFSEPSNEVVLGWKWEARPSGVLEIGLLENIIEFNNSPDFGVHAAWTQRF